ncbi:MAG: hypothetical protein JWO98_2059 [Frankiales bacterium]|nr:hypothetical protein [Frankiales bacterium]
MTAPMVECPNPRCKRRIRIVQPAGGDGSAFVFYRHQLPKGSHPSAVCLQSRMPVPDRLAGPALTEAGW